VRHIRVGFVTEATIERYARVDRWRGRLRLASGSVLFTYVTLHLANHSLGLVSLEAMEAGRVWFVRLWRSPVGAVALYTAFVVHIAMALWAIYRRRTWRMPAWEAAQLALGLTIPVLIAGHVVATKVANLLYAQADPYSRVALVLWQLRPDLGLQQTAAVLVAWSHGCIGIHFWLRLYPWYPRVRPACAVVALLLPVLALLGFVNAGRTAAALAREPGGAARLLLQTVTPAEAASLKRIESTIYSVLGGLLGAVLLARGARRAVERRRGTIRVTHPDGRSAMVPIGFTILEASRSAQIPHASACGGRGRCSTCRVHVVHGLEAIPAATEDERRVLERVAAPPGVRLACQSRPRGDVAVRPLVSPHAATSSVRVARPSLAGNEQQVAVLFADLRRFTTLAERRLPYDVVFFLNRYFEAAGRAIERTGGVTNQFTGDGVMALFGVDGDAARGCRDALRGARAIAESVALLSAAMADELDEPLRIGIGIHTGLAVVGQMGYRDTVYLTAVGDTVHVASRLQDLTKQYQAQLVISEDVASRAAVDVSQFARHEITVRNRREPLAIRVIPELADLRV
jgi:adenylate cyclase